MSKKISDMTELTAIDNNADFIEVLDTSASDNKKMRVRYLVNPSETAMTAYAGGGQANATAITKKWSKFDTVATAADSAKLPDALVGYHFKILNNGAKTMAVFPASGENFDGLTANTSVEVDPLQTLEVFCFVNGTYTII